MFSGLTCRGFGCWISSFPTLQLRLGLDAYAACTARACWECQAAEICQAPRGTCPPRRPKAEPWGQNGSQLSILCGWWKQQQEGTTHPPTLECLSTPEMFSISWKMSVILKRLYISIIFEGLSVIKMEGRGRERGGGIKMIERHDLFCHVIRCLPLSPQPGSGSCSEQGKNPLQI